METVVMRRYLRVLNRGRLGVLFMLLLNACATTQTPDQTAAAKRLHHVVIVWLKQTGDAPIRQHYIEASKPIAQLPGVIRYELGTPAAIQRRNSRAADESYDVAVDSVFESQQAYEAFLKNPEYGRIAQEVLRPLVDKYQVYDFIAP